MDVNTGKVYEVKGDKSTEYKFTGIDNLHTLFWCKYIDEERRKEFDDYISNILKEVREILDLKETIDNKTDAEKAALWKRVKDVDQIYHKAANSNVIFYSNEFKIEEVERAWLEKLGSELIIEYFARAWNRNEKLKDNELLKAEDVVFEDWSKICEELRLKRN